MKHFLHYILIAFLICSCAPGLGSNLRVSEIPEVSTYAHTELSGVLPKVSVAKFADARRSASMGKYKDQTLESEGNIPVNVQSAFERSLKKAGVKLALFNVPTLSADITEWHVNVVPSFPSTEVEAEAGIKLRILDKDGKLVFEGTYSGSAAAKQPMISQSKVEEVLGLSMAYAIDAAITDENLISKLGHAGAL